MRVNFNSNKEYLLCIDIFRGKGAAKPTLALDSRWQNVTHDLMPACFCRITTERQSRIIN